MTVENEKSIAYALIAEKTPKWMKSAPPSSHALMKQAISGQASALQQACQAEPAIAKALATEHARVQNASVEVQALYRDLPSLEAFGKEQLNIAVKEAFGFEVDVSNTYLLDVRHVGKEREHDLNAYQQATHSLLESALRNFQASASEPGGMDNADALLKKSVILDFKGFMGTVPIPNSLDIEPERFARLCRELDIGGQYQAKLHAIHYSDIKTGATKQTTYEKIAELERCTFTQSLHLARLCNDIDQGFYEAALALPLEAPAQSPTLTHSVLSLWGVQLTRLRLFDYRPAGKQASVALYMPGDGDTPLKAFASRTEAERWLRDRLLERPGYLDPCMKERDKTSLRTQLLDRLMPFTLTNKGTHERTADPHAPLHLQAHQLSGSLLQGLVTERVFRHEEDAAFHAIPTSLIDTITAVAHREHVLQNTLTALNIAGFFLPVVGEVMLGVCALQLADEVYEGIESWAHDDRQQAYQYLLDVVTNVAQMAAFTLAVKALGGGLDAAFGGAAKPATLPEPLPVETPSFIEELDDVALPDGRTKLWRADLAPYAQAVDLPQTLQPDSLGLRHHQGRSWLKIDGRAYSVRRSTDGDGYRIEHPTRPDAYQPPLRHNGADIWLHPLDRPEQWSERQLLGRAGVRHEQIDGDTAKHLLRISDIDENALRKALCDNQRLPGQLDDSFTRFKLYRAIEQANPLASPGEIQRDFQRQYQRLPASQLPGAEMLRTRYAQLPLPVIDELLGNATAREIGELGIGKVPRRLADEVRLLQQQIRLNRAYEGLLLDRLRNWDTDCLALHTLERLPGWPADLSITLEQRIHSPRQSMRTGPIDAPPGLTIISAQAGYILIRGESLDAPLNVHASLYGALFEALNEGQRVALGVDHEHALKAMVQQADPLPRPTLRRVLGMQPVAPDFRSPMRLANGRIGYTLGGSRPRNSSISRQTLLARIRQIGLYAPQPRAAEQTLAILERRNLDRSAINDQLDSLLEQRSQLQSSLSNWRQRAAVLPDQSAPDFDQLANAIMQHWYDHAFAAPGSLATPLRLERLSLLDFPLDLPSFFTTAVRDLQLLETQPERYESVREHTPRLRSMLQQFANLRTLEISRAYQQEAPPSPFLFSLPLIAGQLPSLQALSLTHQNIQISTADIESLVDLADLRNLDLSGNRLSDDNPPDFSRLRLACLGLDDMQLEHWPDGLPYSTVSRMQQISLRNNHITLLPHFLQESVHGVTELPQVFLQGNAISQDHMLAAMLDQNGLGTHLEWDQPEAFRELLAQHLEMRQQLHDLLDNYVNASSSTTTLSQAVLAGRTRIAAVLRQFWSSQEARHRNVPLRLTGIALELFPPRLPAFFTERISTVYLENITGTTAQLQDLLSRFPMMTTLTVENYVRAQQDLPTALRQAPQLTNLALRNTGLEVNQAFLDALAPLGRLERLDLSNNRAGTITQAPGTLSNLRRLNLDGMGLGQWPAWVDDLLPLETLDLRDNGLTLLPPRILYNLDNDMPISTIDLQGNPLTEGMVHRARASSESQGSFTLRFDAPDEWNEALFDELLNDFSYVPLDDTPRLADWLLASEVENEALRDTWEQLEGAGDAGELLALVGRLRNTPSYRNEDTRLGICARVRRVLVRALLHPDERALFNIQASEALTQEDGSHTCHDGALLTFKKIELYIASEEFQFEGADSEANFYRELRRLYRVHRVDEVATHEAGDRDVAEVRLTYLRELNGPLQLGQPVDRLLYAISPSIEELIDAQLQVERGEHGEDFLRFAAANEMWVQHLRQVHGQRFAQIESSYRDQVIELQERYPDRPLETLTEAFNALERRRRARETQLIRQLTAFADPDRKPRSTSD